MSINSINCSVHIIDDSETDRYLFKRLLKKANVNGCVFESGNGLEALTFLRDYDTNKSRYADSFPPHVIILDINMPIMNGFEFLEAFDDLRLNGGIYNTIVVAMMTSSDNPKDIDRAKNFNSISAYISKDNLSPGGVNELFRSTLSVGEVIDE